jgi:hypothetical protein
MPDIVKAPWTDQQVANLNRWQTCGHVHPFTCPNHAKASQDGVIFVTSLVAQHDGWHCPDCAYTQTWAHAMMTLGPPPNPLRMV